MLREVPRFHLKLRNGLLDRSPERRPIFNEPPLPGVRDDDPNANGVERLESAEWIWIVWFGFDFENVSVFFFTVLFYRIVLILRKKNLWSIFFFVFEKECFIKWQNGR